uniref:Uncharacterized protein n=1 Tax=Pithovirus LCPAC102 TaxID=2506587 RepID=A0A481Z3P0_9VIRU|nr:MAG: hypothetical protein LCPAC102_00550 [Pithovirus LCPAC102]
MYNINILDKNVNKNDYKQYIKFNDDYNIYPCHNIMIGIHKGLNWYIYRPYNTYLIGYISNIERVINNSKHMKELSEISHWGFTSKIYFECNHLGDWWPNCHMNYGEYRDVPYVLCILINIIDYIMQQYHNYIPIQIKNKKY